MNQVIAIEQKPVIQYDLLESISKEVSEKIKSLNLDTLKPDEGMLSTIKRTRADLNNNFKVLEEQRKMVKDIILAPYNEFEDKYKQLISSQYKSADVELKELVTTVDKGILDNKINGLITYFEEQNTFDFVSFEDMELKIIKSKSDKAIKAEIDIYLDNVKTSLLTIDTLVNKDRVLAKFQISKDLNHSISEVSIEVQHEEKIRLENEKREEAAKIAKEKREEEEKFAKIEDHQEEKVFFQEETNEPQKEVAPKEEIIQCTFKVIGTREQVVAVRNFMKAQGISYE